VSREVSLPFPDLLAVPVLYSAVYGMFGIRIKQKLRYTYPVVANAMRDVEETAWKRETHESFPMVRADGAAFSGKLTSDGLMSTWPLFLGPAR
jgi:hypothetical protein